MTETYRNRNERDEAQQGTFYSPLPLREIRFNQSCYLVCDHKKHQQCKNRKLCLLTLWKDTTQFGSVSSRIFARCRQITFAVMEGQVQKEEVLQSNRDVGIADKIVHHIYERAKAKRKSPLNFYKTAIGYEYLFRAIQDEYDVRQRDRADRIALLVEHKLKRVEIGGLG